MTSTQHRPSLLTLDRLGPSFGAEVLGVDLRTLDDQQVVAVRAALVEHKVIFFRGQDLDDAAQVRLGRRLGEVTAGHPVASSADLAQPEIYNIDSADPEFSFSDVWHTDVTFMERPPLGSILRAVRLPSYGGDTSWVDSQLAYESLSAPVRGLVDGLTAVHDGNREWGAYLRRRGGRGNVWDGVQVTELPPVEHPVVRVHPETGRKGLFVNPGFTSHVVGVSDAESRAILDLLYAHLTKPEHMVRHRWRVGDVGIWDNRSTSHYANRDYTETRVMRRITLQGEPARWTTRPGRRRAVTTTPALSNRAGHARPALRRPDVDADPAARERRHAARIRDLTALLRQRPDIAGVYRPADFSVEAIHWSA